MVVELRDVVGFRGEKLVELRLTDYSAFEQPLFRPGFLGDKWPAVDWRPSLLSGMADVTRLLPERMFKIN